MSKTSKLPDKLSELIVAAVDDCEKVEKDPRYVLQMGTWHQPTGDGRCAVCMAGSVMACRTRIKRTEDVGAHVFTARNWDKFDAIDSARLGELGWSLGTLGTLHRSGLTRAQTSAVSRASKLIKKSFTYGESGGRAPWPVYRKAAAMLAKVGL